MTQVHERRTVVYSGHVQGVGFRWSAVQIARDYEVAGYVRNLADGTVELVAEGAGEELNRFLEAVESDRQEFIRQARVSVSPGTGEFAGFTVRS